MSGYISDDKMSEQDLPDEESEYYNSIEASLLTKTEDMCHALTKIVHKMIDEADQDWSIKRRIARGRAPFSMISIKRTRITVPVDAPTEVYMLPTIRDIIDSFDDELINDLCK